MKNNNLWISDLLAFDGYIILNKTLVKQLGLNNSAFICELCSEFKYYLNNNKLVDTEWFYSTIPNIEENAGLTRYQQEECIKKLEELDIITTKVMGMPSKRYFKINWKKLKKYIMENKQKGKKCQNDTPKSPKIQGCEKLATKDAKNQQPRMRETSNQGCKKLATKDAKNQQPRMQETSNQGCEKLATNNNNITILNNNNKNNNLILSDKDEIRKRQFFDKLNLNEILQEYKDKPVSKSILNNLISIMNSIFTSKRIYWHISGEKIETEKIKNKILTLNEDHIRYIVESIKNNKTEIKNIKAYTMATILNAPQTIDIFYINQVNSDMAKMA